MSGVHLHLLLNHVPVIGMFFAFLILAFAAWRQDSGVAKLGLAVLVGLAVVTVVVFLTGEPAEEAVENMTGVAETMIHPHEEAGEAAMITTAVAGGLALLALVIYRRRPLPRWTTIGALATVVVIGSLLAWTATLGGRIRHTEIGAAGPVAPDSSDRDR